MACRRILIQEYNSVVGLPVLLIQKLCHKGNPMNLLSLSVLPDQSFPGQLVSKLVQILGYGRHIKDPSEFAVGTVFVEPVP